MCALMFDLPAAMSLPVDLGVHYDLISAEFGVEKLASQNGVKAQRPTFQVPTFSELLKILSVVLTLLFISFYRFGI